MVVEATVEIVVVVIPLQRRTDQPDGVFPCLSERRFEVPCGHLIVLARAAAESPLAPRRDRGGAHSETGVACEPPTASNAKVDVAGQEPLAERRAVGGEPSGEGATAPVILPGPRGQEEVPP